MYDTVAQYGQVLGAEVDDWHPPIMVRLWQLLHPLARGTAPMFALQVAAYASGFGLIVAALVRSGRWRAASLGALVGLSPLLLGWQMVVLKDAQMLAALVAAFGLVSHYRLAQRKIPALVAAVIVLLIAYATLVRANALFATVPLAVLLLPRNRPLQSLAIGLAAGLAILLLQPLVNHGLLRAESSDVAKAQPIFDLAAIAVATRSSGGPFTPGEVQKIASRHCVKPFFWDPLGDPTGCSSTTKQAMKASAGQLYLQLARQAALHPAAYIQHRLAHWNSTERWIVRPGLPEAVPPVETEPNDLDLVSPSNPVAEGWLDVAAVQAMTPLGWPIMWTILALMLLPRAWRYRADPAGSLALPLIVSALTLEGSFLVISIASDLRYHLWPMAASALALVLLSADLRLKRSEWAGAAVVLAFVIGCGLYARTVFPRAPESYEGMIQDPSG